MRFLVALVVLCALLGALAPAGKASSGIRFGIQDDAWLAHGPGSLESRLDRLERLGVDVVRFNLHWNEIEAAKGRPDWESSDAVLEGLRARRIGAVVGLVGAPRWANGGKAPNYAPSAASRQARRQRRSGARAGPRGPRRCSPSPGAPSPPRSRSSAG